MSDRLLNERNHDSTQDELEKSVKRPTLWSYVRQMIDEVRPTDLRDRYEWVWQDAENYVGARDDRASRGSEC
jgi:hypothetical protein